MKSYCCLYMQDDILTYDIIFMLINIERVHWTLMVSANGQLTTYIHTVYVTVYVHT